MYLTLALCFTLGVVVQGQSSCNKQCVQHYQPVCGSDRHTYSNLCTLQIAECKARLQHRRLTLSHSGACSTHSGTTHHYVNSHCDTICDDEVHTVKICANNGVTYATHCEYENAACMFAKNHTSLPVRHTGECTSHDLDCPLTCNSSDVTPVCSKGNHTYRNACYMKQMECRYSHIETVAQNFTLGHTGSCDGIDFSITQKYDCSPFIINSQVAVEGTTVLLKSCPHAYSPVCGVDHRTHTNGCYICRTMAARGKLGADHMVDILAEQACPSYLFG